MKQVIGPVLVALLLIGGGTILLLYNFGILGVWGAWIWTAAFAVAGVVFVSVFVVDRKHWWAVIPGGIFIVMAVIPVLELFLPEDVTGSLFFVGVGLVFGVLYLLRSPERPLGWAIWPALGCCGFGLFVLVVNAIENWILVIGPATLIVLGLIIIWRSIRSGR